MSREGFPEWLLSDQNGWIRISDNGFAYLSKSNKDYVLNLRENTSRGMIMVNLCKYLIDGQNEYRREYPIAGYEKNLGKFLLVFSRREKIKAFDNLIYACVQRESHV